MTATATGGVAELLALARATGKLEKQDLQNLRFLTGMTQERISAAIGVHLDNWQNWEQGRKQPMPVYFQMILEFMARFERWQRKNPIATASEYPGRRTPPPARQKKMAIAS